MKKLLHFNISSGVIGIQGFDYLNEFTITFPWRLLYDLFPIKKLRSDNGHKLPFKRVQDSVKIQVQPLIKKMGFAVPVLDFLYVFNLCWSGLSDVNLKPLATNTFIKYLNEYQEQAVHITTHRRWKWVLPENEVLSAQDTKMWWLGEWLRRLPLPEKPQ